MEDNRNERNFRERNHPRDHGRGRNFHRPSRDSHGGHGGGGRGRPQRPLLTSSINGAGLTLVALVLLLKDSASDPVLTQRLALAVVAFGLSALISYVAQRVKPLIIELVSDLFFLMGGVLLVYVALRLGGLLPFAF